MEQFSIDYGIKLVENLDINALYNHYVINLQALSSFKMTRPQSLVDVFIFYVWMILKLENNICSSFL